MLAKFGHLFLVSIGIFSLTACEAGLGRSTSASAPMIAPASPLWARSSALPAAEIAETTTTDNALVLNWSENGATPEGYLIFLDGTGSSATFFETSIPYVWFNSRKVFLTTGSGGVATSGVGIATDVPFVPGSTHSVEVWSTNGNLVSGAGPSSRAQLTLTSPSIRVGDPASGSSISPSPSAIYGFWDENGNGYVDGLLGRGRPFPRALVQTGALRVGAGADFDSSGGVRANVVVMSLFQEHGVSKFISFHMFINPVRNDVTPVSMHYGDWTEGPGAIWISPPSALVLQRVSVIDGVPLLNPNIVEGLVLGGALNFPDNSQRILELSFRVALESR
jgi:hypothetical protein